ACPGQFDLPVTDARPLNECHGGRGRRGVARARTTAGRRAARAVAATPTATEPATATATGGETAIASRATLGGTGEAVAGGAGHLAATAATGVDPVAVLPALGGRLACGTAHTEDGAAGPTPSAAGDH